MSRATVLFCGWVLWASTEYVSPHQIMWRLLEAFETRQECDSGIRHAIIPARYGQIEWFDGRDLAVYCDHPRLFPKLWAIPGVRRHQTGDHEMRAIFPPEALDQVARVIRAKRWGGSGCGRAENLLASAGQRDTSPG